MVNLRRTLPLVLLLVPGFATNGPAQQSDLAARRAHLHDALEQEWQYALRTSPELATGIGDPRYNDRWADYSVSEQQRQTEHARAQIRVFEAIDTAGFPEQEILDKTLMLRQLREAVEEARFKGWEMPVDQMNGIQLGIPGLMNPTASRNVIDRIAQALLHDDAARLSLPPSFVPSALAEIVVLSDFWSPIGDIKSMLAGLSASGAHGTLVQVVDPAEESFPYAGRVEFVEPEGGGVITAGRAEKWASDYVARVALHRDQIRGEANKLDWLFSIHTTNRSAAELLLFLHAGMMVNKGSARAATVKAGRSA